MEERKIERGEVYYVRYDESVGAEMAVGRPVLVVSNQSDIEKYDTVICVFLTRTPGGGHGVVKVMLSGRPSYIKCNQIQTLDKSRFNTLMCKLDEPTMKRVNGALTYAVSANTRPVEVEVETKNDIGIENRVELELYQKLYAKAMAELMEMRFAYDELKFKYNKFENQKTVEPEIEFEEVEEIEVKVEEYPKKVNVNTCRWQDLVGIGVSKTVALSVTGTRKKLGRFDTLEDLLLCDRFKQSHLNRFRDKLEV